MAMRDSWGEALMSISLFIFGMAAVGIANAWRGGKGLGYTLWSTRLGSPGLGVSSVPFL